MDLDKWKKKPFFGAILLQVFYVRTIAIRTPKHKDPVLGPRRARKEDGHQPICTGYCVSAQVRLCLAVRRG